jgi:hypothetical protein
MELLDFINLLKDKKMPLSWCGTGMPDDLVINISMHHWNDRITSMMWKDFRYLMLQCISDNKD